MKFYTDLCLTLLSILVLWVGSLWIVNNPTVIKSRYPSFSQQTEYSSIYANGYNTFSLFAENRIASLKFNDSSNFNSNRAFVKLPSNDFQFCENKINISQLTNSMNNFKFSPTLKSDFDSYNFVKKNASNLILYTILPNDKYLVDFSPEYSGDTAPPSRAY